MIEQLHDCIAKVEMCRTARENTMEITITVRVAV